MGVYVLSPLSNNVLIRAALEIRAYEQYFNLTPSEEDASNFVKDEVIAIAKAVIPGVSVNRLGSHIYGLGTPTSDIDLKIFHPDFEKPPFSRGPSPGRPESRKKNLDYLKTLQTALVESTLFYEPEIFDAKVPNFKVLHRYTNIIVNIQICLENTPETYYREAYLAEFPTLRALYILLRSALQIRGLNSTYEGGLGSYSIFMMIVYALKTGSPRIRSDDIAAQLLHTLEIYAGLNLYEYGFSLEPPTSFRKLHEEEKRSLGGSKQSGIEKLRVINRRQPYCLCLQDPANSLNDLGKKSYQIKNIQRVFLHTRKDIQKAMWEYTSFVDSYPGDTYRDALLYSLVGANYEAFERGRSNLEEKVGDSKNLNEYMQIAQSKIKQKFSID